MRRCRLADGVGGQGIHVGIFGSLGLAIKNTYLFINLYMLSMNIKLLETIFGNSAAHKALKARITVQSITLKKSLFQHELSRS